MTERQKAERNKRAAKYAYIIKLLVKGYSIHDAVFLNNSNSDTHISENTARKLRREFVMNEDRYENGERKM
jgi:hypothetical protein